MFETLIESHRERGSRRTFGAGVVSLLVHAAVITVAVVATSSAGRGTPRARVDTSFVYVAPPRPPRQRTPPLARLDVPLKGFQTVVAPSEVPSNIPPVNLQEKFNPKDYSGIGVEGGVASGVAPAGEVYLEAFVEEAPVLLAGPEVRYPDLLRQARIQGRVLVQAILDTTGRAEPASIKVLRTPNPGFDEPSRNWLLHAQFRPARVHGRAVRVLVNVPIDYRITSA